MSRMEVHLRPFLKAEWRDLVILNYPVEASLLLPMVPRGTELDRWEGQALVSLVAFRFLDTRVLGVSIPFHRDFEEVNLRFYVRRAAPEGIRRAVVFVRELVPRRAIAWVAWAWYNEPYRAAPMRHAIVETGSHRRLTYEWRDPNGWRGVSAGTTGPSVALTRGSQAEFITEHFWGYTRQRDGGTVEYQVEHPSWRVWDAQEYDVEGNLAATYGRAFAIVLSRPPVSAFVADGSPVTVYRPRRLTAAELASGAG